MHHPFFKKFPIFELSPSSFPALSENDLRPDRVWVQGQPKALLLLEKLPDRGLGVVGSRIAQDRTVRHVRSTILELEGQNLIILSGLASGVDAVAHQSALDAGLPTVAVVAHGLQAA